LEKEKSAFFLSLGVSLPICERIFSAMKFLLVNNNRLEHVVAEK
jgi:hypothetical protein